MTWLESDLAGNPSACRKNPQSFADSSAVMAIHVFCDALPLPAAEKARTNK